MGKNQNQADQKEKKDQANDLSFIEEFIELKKSQNRILKDIIEKLKSEEKHTLNDTQEDIGKLSKNSKTRRNKKN